MNYGKTARRLLATVSLVFCLSLGLTGVAFGSSAGQFSREQALESVRSALLPLLFAETDAETGAYVHDVANEDGVLEPDGKLTAEDFPITVEMVANVEAVLNSATDDFDVPALAQDLMDLGYDTNSIYFCAAYLGVEQAIAGFPALSDLDVDAAISLIAQGGPAGDFEGLLSNYEYLVDRDLNLNIKDMVVDRLSGDEELRNALELDEERVNTFVTMGATGILQQYQGAYEEIARDVLDGEGIELAATAAAIPESLAWSAKHYCESADNADDQGFSETGNILVAVLISIRDAFIKIFFPAL